MRVQVKEGYFFLENATYRAGDVLSLPDDQARDLVRRSAGSIVLCGDSPAKAAASTVKKKTPAKTGAPKAEEGITLPEADAAAAVKGK